MNRKYGVRGGAASGLEWRCLGVSAWALAIVVVLFSGASHALRPSAGCGQAVVGDFDASVEIDGMARDSIVVVPPSYRSDQPQQLIFGFHGRTGDNRQVRSYFRLEGASQRSSIFIYPAGTRDSKHHTHWWRHHDAADQLRDYVLFDALLERLAAAYCIDLDRVFVVGHSLGATFANSLACARGDRIRGLLSVAGGIRRAECSGPVAAMLLHNPKDDLVAIAAGERARDWLLAANPAVTSGAPGPTKAAALAALNCQRYGAAGIGNPLLWCPHHIDVNGHQRFYPHNWPAATATAAFALFDALPDPVISVAQ